MNAQAQSVINTTLTTPYETAYDFELYPVGNWVTVDVITPASHGTVVVDGSQVFYTPAPGYSGPDSFSLQASGFGSNPRINVAVTVSPPALPSLGDVPASAADWVFTLTTPYETPIDFEVFPIGGWVSTETIQAPSHGTIVLDGSSVEYTPAPGYFGNDTFSFRIVGGSRDGQVVTVNVTVELPPAPVAVDVAVNTAYQTSVAIPLTATGVFSTLEVLTMPAVGSVSLTGQIATFTPAPGFIGLATFTYRAIGPGGNSNPATVTATVMAPPAPVAEPLSLTTPYETPRTIALSATGFVTSYELVGVPSHGAASQVGDQVIYTPAAGYYGADSFTYRATGPGGASTLATISVQVELPAAPGAGNVSANTAYETATAITLTPSGVFTSIEKLSDPANGVVSFAGNVATYTPTAGFYGVNTFTYRAVGPGGNSEPATVTVVVAVPPPPTAADTSLTTPFETARTVVLPVAGVLTAVNVIDQPSHGSASITGTTLTYTPAAGYYGSDQLTYRATGPGGASQTRTVTIGVAVPPAPSVAGGSITTAYQTVGSRTLAVSGYSPVLALASGPTNGLVSLGGTVVTYTPGAGFYGSDSFTVTASNAGGVSAPATITVSVGLPPPPSVAPASITTAYNATGSTTLVPAGVYDTLQIVSLPSHGSAVISGTTLTYSPTSSYFGPDQLTVRATGPGGTSDVATVSISVGLPGAPSISAATITTAFGQSGDADLVVNGVFNTVEIVSQPAHGSAVLIGQRVTYTPAAGYYGLDAFPVRAIGPGGTSDLATVSVSVGQPAAPIAAPSLTLNTPYETPGEVTLSATGVTTGYSLTSQPAHGTAVLSGDRVIYTPISGYSGSDVFSYRATGPGGASASATVAVSVGLPPAPTAQAGSLTTSFETVGTLNLQGSGVYSSHQLVDQPAHGVVAISSGVASYTPATGYFGPDAFTFTVTGPGGVSAPATISVIVGIPGRPVASPDSIETDYETPGAVTLRATGVYEAFSITSAPTHGLVSIDAGQANYVPAAGFCGPDAFSFVASGPGGVSNVATIAVTVRCPTGLNVPDAELVVPHGTAGSLEVAVTGVYNALVIDAQPSHGVAVLDGSRLTYTPSAGYHGVDAIGIRANGPGGASARGTISVTVGVPAPVATDVSASTGMDEAVTLPLASPETLFVTSVELGDRPANGEVTMEGRGATYTPASGFVGQDTFTFRLAGPGGVSAWATATISVTGGDVPVAQDMVKEGLAGQPIVFDVTAGLANGPFTGIQLTSSPNAGSAVIDGQRIIYTPTADWTGSASFGFAVRNRYGWSQAAQGTAVVNARPLAAAVIDAETWAGQPVDIPLTDTATGEPFTAADIVALSLPNAAELTVVKVGERYILRATPQGRFVGLIEIRYTLRNAFAVSEPGLVRLTVKERPDPTSDPDVPGLVNSQTQAAYRFGFAQTDNVLRRLEQLHDGRAASDRFNLTLIPMNDEERPWETEAQRSQRQFREQNDNLVPNGSERAGQGQAAQGDRTAQGSQGPWAIWAEGVIDLGFNRRDDVRSGIDFQTNGITVGADTRLNETLAVGAGLGYGRDESDIGLRGTASSAEAWSSFVYASWLPRDKLFVDGVLGVATMDYDAVRFLTQTGGFLGSQRSGHQVFGSIAAGYDSQGPRLRWSPYARVQFAEVTLDAFQEYGSDLWALRFAEQNSSQIRATLGVHGDYLFQYREGALRPTFRAEYLHDLKNGGVTNVRYADWAASPLYEIELAPYDDRNLLLGLGLRWEGLNGAALGFNYESTILNDTAQQGRLRFDFSIRY